MRASIILVFIVGFLPIRSNAQVLISLLFGDKLNSDGIEFGLDGGYTLSDLQNDPATGLRSALNLGMYFDVRLSEPWYIHTGFILRSPVGVNDFEPYLTGNPDFDPYVPEADRKRRLDYIYLPAFIRYKFYRSTFVELGPQIGYLTGAEDRFEADVNGGELRFIRPNLEEYNRWDAGLTIGAGGRPFKSDGFTMGVRYYYGLTNVSAIAPDRYNRILYLYMSIPVGADKSE